MHDNYAQNTHAPVSARRHANTSNLHAVPVNGSETRSQQRRHERKARKLRLRDTVQMKRWQLYMLMSGVVAVGWAAGGIIM